MTVIWLSPGLPADRSAIAAALGPGVDVVAAGESGSTAELPAAGTTVAVVTAFERPLLERLAAVPDAGSLLVLKPPGSATPSDLPVPAGPATVAEAGNVAEAADAIRSTLDSGPKPWPTSLTGQPVAAAGGWLPGPDPAPTGPLAGAVPVAGERSHISRRNWLASAGIIGAAALAAILVLATQGGASDSTASGRNRGFPGGNGAAGGAQLPTGQMPGGALPGAAPPADPQAPSGTSDRSASRRAFLDCLQKNGVDVSTLRAGGRPRLDPSDPTVASAMQACFSLLPGRGVGGAGGPGGGQPGIPGMPGFRPGV